MSRNIKLALGAAFVLTIGFLALTVGAAVAAPAAGLGLLLALTIPPSLAARNSGEQQIHYFRYRLTVASVSALAGGVKIGRLPARAFIHSAAIYKSTPFNSVTSDSLVLGSTKGGNDISATITLQTAGYLALTPAGLGMVVGATGEVDIWAQYSQVGTAATAGDATLVLAYFPDNDQ